MATQAELETRIADLERRIAELQEDDAPRGMFHLLDQVLPAESRQHMRAAQKEQLLAFRALLDRWISRMDDEKPTPRREAIRVE